MTHPVIDDLVTVEELAARLGGDDARARRMLKKAKVPVFDGGFSGSAFEAALGGPFASGPSSTEELDRIHVLLGEKGLVLHGLMKRRTLEGTLSSRPGHEVYYLPRYAHEEDYEGLKDFPPNDRADEVITISTARPRRVRVLVKRAERSGAVEYTVGGLVARGSDHQDFVIFVGPRFDRFWILAVRDGASIRHDLLIARDQPKYAPVTPTGFSLHPNEATLRVQFSRKPSIFDATSALTEQRRDAVAPSE